MTSEQKTIACEQITAEAFGKIEGLFKLIRNYVKMPELKLEATLATDRYGEHRIEFESADLTDDNYLISLAWKEFKICQFNSSASIKRDETEAPYYWMTIEYRYKSHGCGMNGTELGTAFFEDGKWSFVAEADRKAK